MRRFIELVSIYTTAVWLVTFSLLARSLKYDADWYPANWLRCELHRLVSQAVSLDEELIVLTCLTLWAVSWGLAFAVFRTATLPRRLMLIPLLGTGGAFAAVLLGGGFLRHFFHGYWAEIFHVAFSASIVAGYVMAYRFWWRDFVRSYSRMSV